MVMSVKKVRTRERCIFMVAVVEEGTPVVHILKGQGNGTSWVERFG